MPTSSTKASRRALTVLAGMLVLAGLLTGQTGTARAQTPVALGADVSWPQCPAGTGVDVGGGYGIGLGNPMPPTTVDFLVIGLTAGLPFTRNPCLVNQVRFALTHGIPRDAYTMAAYPTSAQVTKYGGTGPASGSTTWGRLYNTGYAMARYDLQTLAGVGLSVPFVWIDVESRAVQNWPTGTDSKTSNNRAVLSGYAKGFQNARMRTGWYSYRTGWAAITGGWRDGAPMWKAGDYTGTGYPGAQSICSTPSLNGGPIWMGQRVSGRSDLDATCPPLPSLATVFDGAVPPSVSPVVPGAPAVPPDTPVSFRTTLGTSQIWSATLTDACTGAPVTSWDGIAKGLLTITWDGREDSGSVAPVGLYRLAVASSGITRTVVVEVSQPGTTVLGSCGLVRTYGADRYATSVAVGRVSAPDARTVVLAAGAPDHLVDGLVAAPLARALGAPLLLSTPTVLPATVRADLVARGVTTAYLVGGPASLSPDLVTQLRAELGLTRVVRVDGANRYETAAKVAAALVHAGAATDATAWVAAGADDHLVDALAAGGPAAAAGEPILLTTATTLPTATASALTTLATTSTRVLGGPDVIGTTVLDALPAPQRVFGATRYSTAAAVATLTGRTDAALLTCGLGPSLVDALPGGTLGLPTVLSAGSTLPAATSGWLTDAGPAVTRVVGGPVAVPPSVLGLLHP